MRKGTGWGRRDRKELNYMEVERERTLGDEHAVQRVEDVMCNCAPGTYVIFADQCHPIHLTINNNNELVLLSEKKVIFEGDQHFS